MTLHQRIKTLEKHLSPVTGNPFADWTDEELGLSISLLDKEIQTGQKQEWPEELARKQREASKNSLSGPFSDLSDEELMAAIKRMERELMDIKVLIL